MTKAKVPTDAKFLRPDEGQHLKRDVVTASSSTNRSELINRLKESLATEPVSLLRYRYLHSLANSMEGQGNIDGVAQRIAIERYRDLGECVDNNIPTTIDMLKTMLAAEEEHASALADLLKNTPSKV